MIEEIESRFREEHLKELKKYSVGELMEAIENRGISRHDIDRYKVIQLDKNDKDSLVGGFCVVFVIRNIDKDELDSIKTDVSKE